MHDMGVAGFIQFLCNFSEHMVHANARHTDMCTHVLPHQVVRATAAVETPCNWRWQSGHKQEEEEARYQMFCELMSGKV
jgi:hypothetical protein